MINRLSIHVLLSVCLVGMIGISSTAGAEVSLVVAPDGSDQNHGTEQNPLATFARALDLARAIRAKQAGPLTILMRSGV